MYITKPPRPWMALLCTAIILMNIPNLPSILSIIVLIVYVPWSIALWRRYRRDRRRYLVDYDAMQAYETIRTETLEVVKDICVKPNTCYTQYDKAENTTTVVLSYLTGKRYPPLFLVAVIYVEYGFYRLFSFAGTDGPVRYEVSAYNQTSRVIQLRRIK